MNLEWWSAENPVAWWWLFLCTASALNILIWGWVKLTRWNLEVSVAGDAMNGSSLGARALNVKNSNSAEKNSVQIAQPFDAIPQFWLGLSQPHRWMITLSAFYVFGCAFRSLLPRADVQRIVLFDSWLSSVFVGRTVATFAELAFVAQWSLIIALFSEQQSSRLLRLISALILIFIAFAECFSWGAVITTNYLGNVIEESLWALSYSLVALALAITAARTKESFRVASAFGCIGSMVYVGFMAAVDVPMYFGRWLQDQQAMKPNLSLIEGLIDLNTRWVVTHSIEDWLTEIPWMSLYFSLAVLVSLVLCYVPLEVVRTKNSFAQSESKLN